MKATYIIADLRELIGKTVVDESESKAYTILEFQFPLPVPTEPVLVKLEEVEES